MSGWKLIVLMLLLAGCYQGQPAATSPPPAAATPTASVTPPPPATAAPPAAEGWLSIAPGLEQRSITPHDTPLAQFVVVRIDPAYYSFRAHYRAGQPLNLTAWQQELPGAAVIINANFFDPDHRVLGLLVSDGVVHGSAYQGRGGMFAVQNGLARVRSNTAEPFGGEALEQAVQAFPMLVLDGLPVFFDTSGARVTRRTVVAQDSAGRILLMATPGLGMPLHILSAWLPTTDLEIVNAFNLDGGGSTMMYVAASTYDLRSFDPVPAVLAVYPR